MTRCMLAIAISLALLIGASAAARQSGKKRARIHFIAGKKLFKKKKYRKAIARLKKAYRLWKHRVIVFNLALAHAHLGERIKAMTYLRLFLAVATAKEKRLPRILERLRQEVGVLVVQVPDPQAVIYVDGRRVGKGRVELVVEPGKKTIEIRIGSRVVTTRSIVVPAGKEKVWELAEMPRPRPARRPPRPRAIAHRQRAPRPSRLHWGYFSAAAMLTATTLATAVVMSVKTRKLYDDFRASGRTDPVLHNDGERYQLIANVFWGVTAAAAAGTTIIAIFTRWRRPERHKPPVSVTPAVWPGGASLTITW